MKQMRRIDIISRTSLFSFYLPNGPVAFAFASLIAVILAAWSCDLVFRIWDLICLWAQS
jgi:hypothetical protein